MGVLGCIPFAYSHVIVGGGNQPFDTHIRLLIVKAVSHKLSKVLVECRNLLVGVFNLAPILAYGLGVVLEAAGQLLAAGRLLLLGDL